ncbi:hypothetical protein C5B96_10725 [Subtercola sp. Z020]|uniref:TolB family protein n=1 Tax=Subtercola sp. Z020 TaxID=2080582 RepID=UPI000CE7897B|nr:PD40 domain-containing protein [Subtercola sp. Z020]PPF80752.1 hypothetical protein C5B96_10725 [Subtercola sp. Z020]
MALAVLGLGGTVLAATAEAALPAAGETVMTSVDLSTPPSFAGAGALNTVVSADGRFVAFSSPSTNLTSIDPHGHFQIYKRDMVTGVTSLVSLAMSGNDSGDSDSSEPAISADGRYISFTSTSRNLALPVPLGVGVSQVYVVDTVTSSTRLLSMTPGLLSAGDRRSWNSSISADGSLVAYQSFADDLVTGLLPTTTQVYVSKTTASPMTRLVSARNATTNGLPNDQAVDPSISGDGRSVAFASQATDLMAVPSGGLSQVYVRVLATDTTSLISIDQADASLAGDGGSGRPSLSFDGSRVAYESGATNLSAAATGGNGQVFLFDRATMKNVLQSVARDGTSGADDTSVDPSISADGSRVAFLSMATDLTDISTFGVTQVYVHQVGTSTTRAMSVQSGDATAGGSLRSLEVALSGDGGYVAFTSVAPGLSAVPGSSDRSQTYLRAYSAVAPTPSATATAEPTSTPSNTTTSATPAPPTGPGTGVASGQGGTGGSGRLASTGMSQAPIIVAGIAALVLALVGGSILVGARAARRRKRAAGATDVDAVDPVE